MLNDELQVKSDFMSVWHFESESVLLQDGMIRIFYFFFYNLDPVHFVFGFTIHCDVRKAEFEPDFQSLLRIKNNKVLQ